jgi:hypothetical protein
MEKEMEEVKGNRNLHMRVHEEMHLGNVTVVEQKEATQGNLE